MDKALFEKLEVASADAGLTPRPATAYDYSMYELDKSEFNKRMEIMEQVIREDERDKCKAIDKTEYAFPQGQQVGSVSVSEGGVTLRDYFAAKAMNAQMLGAIQGKSQDLISAMKKIGTDDPYVLLAKNSYDMADAMLDARNADNSDIALAKERLKTVDTAIKVDINEL